MIERAVIFSPREIIRPRDLPEALRESSGGRQKDAMLSLDEVEKRHILRVLRETAGNKVRAARILDIPRASLYRKLERYAAEGESRRLPRAGMPVKETGPAPELLDKV